jgi:CRISPR-associated RAMP protein (TIGR02581 family)
MSSRQAQDAGFDRFQSRTIITAVLEMDTGVSVGGRASLEPTGTDLPVVRAADGKPFIPGSSIKGVVRSQLERVIRSVSSSERDQCDPLVKPCVGPGLKDQLMNQAGRNEEEFARLVWDQSCKVCRLFGSPWFSSRLFFRDAPLTNADDLLVATQIRDGVGIDRDRGAAKDRLKYDFEVAVFALRNRDPLRERGTLGGRPTACGPAALGGRASANRRQGHARAGLGQAGFS